MDASGQRVRGTGRHAQAYLRGSSGSDRHLRTIMALGDTVPRECATRFASTAEGTARQVFVNNGYILTECQGLRGVLRVRWKP